MESSKIRNFIVEKFPGAKAKSLDDSTRLLEEGIIDSLGVLELVTFLEEEMGVTASDEDLVPENFASVEAIAAFARSKLQQSETA